MQHGSKCGKSIYRKSRLCSTNELASKKFMTRKVFICSGIISQIRQCRTKEPIYFLDPTHLGPSVLNEIKDLTVSIVAPKTDQCRK